jgi:pyridoxamine 5'-phosphate oxidase
VTRSLSALNEAEAHHDPLVQFRAWLDEEVQAGLRLPAPVVLATATLSGSPSARTVLLNAFDERGFVFYSNYESRKGRELAENPRGELLFLWAGYQRQVRSAGRIATISAAESDAYFHSRPKDSQLSAWASRQSAVISGREVLEARMLELTAHYDGREVPRPPYWGGYRLTPETMEFWQSRPSRLHDRLFYRRHDDGRWRIERLSP